MWNDVGPESYRDCTINYARELSGYTAYIRWPAEFLSADGRLWLKTYTEELDAAREIATTFIDMGLRFGPEFVKRFVDPSGQGAS